MIYDSLSEAIPYIYIYIYINHCKSIYAIIFHTVHKARCIYKFIRARQNTSKNSPSQSALFTARIGSLGLALIILVFNTTCGKDVRKTIGKPYTKTIGKPKENSGLMSFYGGYPLVNTDSHSYWKWPIVGSDQCLSTCTIPVINPVAINVT